MAIFIEHLIWAECVIEFLVSINPFNPNPLRFYS